MSDQVNDQSDFALNSTSDNTPNEKSPPITEVELEIARLLLQRTP